MVQQTKQEFPQLLKEINEMEDNLAAKGKPMMETKQVDNATTSDKSCGDEEEDIIN